MVSYMNDETVVNLIKKYKTPLFIYDYESDIIEIGKTVIASGKTDHDG